MGRGKNAGSAKTFIGCYWILKSSLKYPGSRWLIGRSVLKNLKQTTLQTFFEVCKKQGVKKDIHYSYKEQAGEIHFQNGSVILLMDLDYKPSDPEFDSLGSLEVCGIFCDEIAQIRKKAWDILLTRIRYQLEEFGIEPKIFGSLNPSKNWVYTYFYKPFRDGVLDEKKRFIRALPTDNPYLPKSYLQVLNDLPKSERDRLYLGLWEADDDNQLAKQDAIIAIFDNTWVDNTSQNFYIIGDIARMGSDRAVIGVWKGLRLIKVVMYEKSKFNLLEDTIIDLKNTYKISNSNIILDCDGVGGFLADAIGAEEFINNSKALNDEQYQNLKTQCYYKLTEFINEKKIYIEKDVFNESDKEMLIEELEQIKSSPTEDSKLKIISKTEVKSNIGRSPDISDMLMMRMYYELDINNGDYYFL